MGLIRRIFKDPSPLRNSIIGLYIFLIIYNVFAWLWAFYVFHDHPILFSTAVLAYTLGLRHAVDVDHIAAIDNVTRKFMQEGKPAVTVGFYFSLGHSTTVVVASIAVALVASSFLQGHLSPWRDAASIIATSISALFLIVIAIINLVIFFSIYQVFQEVRRGNHYRDEEINKLLSKRGFLTQRFRHLFQIIQHSWQMYPLGFLFGIGFDTATEVAVLGIAATQALNHLSLSSILIFPALFTAGMTLIDSTDCVIMIGAYGWAFMKPLRKLYYNLTITFVSVIVAIFIGTIQALGLIADKIEAEGFIWDIIRSLSKNFNIMGYIIILIFMASWGLSVVYYKFMGFDKLEEKK